MTVAHAFSALLDLFGLAPRRRRRRLPPAILIAGC